MIAIAIIAALRFQLSAPSSVTALFFMRSPASYYWGSRRVLE